MSETREAIAPCPFCGDIAACYRDEHEVYVQCDECNARSPNFLPNDDGERSARAAWNRRALSARDERAEERERAALIVERWSLPTIQTPSMWLIDKAGIAAAIRAGGTDG